MHAKEQKHCLLLIAFKSVTMDAKSTCSISVAFIMKCYVAFVAILLIISTANAFQRVVPERWRSHDGYHAESRQQRGKPSLVGEEGLIERLYNSRRTRRSSTAIGTAVKFKNFEQMLERNLDKPILVSFQAKWCGPCQLAKKELKTVRDEIGDDVHVFAVDTEKWPAVAARYAVEGLPTLVIFYRGEILYRVEGVEPAEKLVHRVRTITGELSF